MKVKLTKAYEDYVCEVDIYEGYGYNPHVVIRPLEGLVQVQASNKKEAKAMVTENPAIFKQKKEKEEKKGTEVSLWVAKDPDGDIVCSLAPLQQSDDGYWSNNVDIEPTYLDVGEAMGKVLAPFAKKKKQREVKLK